MSDFHGRLTALATLWNKIEKRAKAAEQFRGESIIAAINEISAVFLLATLAALEAQGVRLEDL